MNDIKYPTKEEILERGREVIGLPLRDIDQTGRLDSGKGAIGSVIEESWFGYSINSKSKPDFEKAGVELKVTPFYRKGKYFRAKERLVCNIINYMEEYKKTFNTSSFWKKCENILLMSYEHKDDIKKGDFIIAEVVLFSFPESDLEIIKDDWEKIIHKIRQGKAHELSEGDTFYLGACTKGVTAKKSLRKQPFSDILAKQRAYSLKQSYMTYVLNNYIFGKKQDENIIKNLDEFKSQNFETYIKNKITPYIGQSQESLMKYFNIIKKSKNINQVLVARMLDINARISETAEFKKANIVPKTIRANNNGSITEHMSFPIFDFTKIVNEKWETCELKQMMEQTKFLFIIFKFSSSGDLVFRNIMFWNMPASDFDDLRIVWEKTVKVLKEGVILRKSGKRTFNNLPNASDSRIAHVRPHAKNAQDTMTLPNGNVMPKQSFWLNNTYIRQQIESAQKK